MRDVYKRQTEAGYAPFEFLDENDNVVGLDASLAQALDTREALRWRLDSTETLEPRCV